MQETKAFSLAHVQLEGWHLFWEPSLVGPGGDPSGGVAIAVKKSSEGALGYKLVPTPLDA